MAVISFCEREGLPVDGKKFFDYYNERCWQIDGKPINSWKGIARRWGKRIAESPDAEVSGRIAQALNLLEHELEHRTWGDSLKDSLRMWVAYCIPQSRPLLKSELDDAMHDFLEDARWHAETVGEDAVVSAILESKRLGWSYIQSEIIDQGFGFV